MGMLTEDRENVIISCDLLLGEGEMAWFFQILN